MSIKLEQGTECKHNIVPFADGVSICTMCDECFMDEIETQIFICRCHSFSHQAIFWYDEEDKNLYVNIHLITHRNIFKRIWVAIKYVFGYTSKYGEWDDFIFKDRDLKTLKEYLASK